MAIWIWRIWIVPLKSEWEDWRISRKKKIKSEKSRNRISKRTEIIKPIMGISGSERRIYPSKLYQRPKNIESVWKKFEIKWMYLRALRYWIDLMSDGWSAKDVRRLSRHLKWQFMADWMKQIGGNAVSASENGAWGNDKIADSNFWNELANSIKSIQYACSKKFPFSLY